MYWPLYTSCAYDLYSYQHLIYKEIGKLKWWVWFREGVRFQPSKKRKIQKKSRKVIICYWLRILPHKSGWIGKAMKRKKGK